MDQPIDHIRAIRNKVKSLLKHEERKLQRQLDDAAEAGQYGRYGQIADSLMADPSAAPRGTAKGAVVNIHTESIEEVSLNPAMDAVENAELLYRKARRGKRGHEIAAGMAAETEARVNKLRDVIAGIDGVISEKKSASYLNDTVGATVPGRPPPDANDDDANPHISTPHPAVGATIGRPPAYDDDDLARIREIAAEFVPIEDPRAAAKKKNLPPPPPFKKYMIDGWEVYLGKNSTQNDELSTRFARPSDIWLHVAGYSGSHVIIRRRKDTPAPPAEVVRKAAQLAVWHSKAKHTSFAEVHVTEARFVRKRRHAPPGEVIAERCKLVRVEPKELKTLIEEKVYDND